MPLDSTKLRNYMKCIAYGQFIHKCLHYFSGFNQSYYKTGTFTSTMFDREKTQSAMIEIGKYSSYMFCHNQICSKIQLPMNKGTNLILLHLM